MNTQFTRPTVSPPPELIARFTAIVGDRYAITDPAGQEPYLIEGRGLYRGARVARLPPSCELVHRGLRIPGLRTGDDSPSEARHARRLAQAAVPEGDRSKKSAAAARAPHTELSRDHTQTSDRRTREKAAALSMLQSAMGERLGLNL